MDGTDELSNLTSTINSSLGAMERSQLELHQLNTQLEEKVSDLNVLQTYRDRFFTNASHEFRTPMAVLRTQLYLAQKQPALWQKHLDILTTTTNQLSDILSDVFDMAQFRRQNGILYRQEVEFRALVTKTLASERSRMPLKGLQLSTEYPNHDLYLQGDQSALEQAIEKLFGFIINYCKQDSEIKVSLTSESVDNISYAILEISSLGLQVAPSDLDQIFLPFYKSSEGNIRNTGLQLSIAKEVTELHKGEIRAEADTKKGICFRMKLPTTRMGEEIAPKSM
jgi:signal transduction histidine kinase